MNTAIIVAAGSGSRFGGEIPKQFLTILGRPVLIHTLEKFESCLSIDAIILVLAKNEISNFESEITKYNIKKVQSIIAGGKTRAESVLNGLKSVDLDSAGIVAVHDGARPLVTVDEISATIKKAKETGAACLVANVTDTIKEVANGNILRTIERTKLRSALTPQCFRYEILQRAFEENNDGQVATDECYLVEKLGVEIAVVEGSSKNIKITTPEDLVFVENIIGNQRKTDV